jgi:superfamily II DNA or RNA helicase
LIVVPTLDLADQWTRSLLTLGCPEDKIGLVTGSVKKTEELTVTTYESALIQIRTFRDKFGLLVFDEVHHLRGNFRFIGEGYVAPARLGLTATIDQTLSDELHDIVGPVVFHLKPEELLAEGYIANFELRRVLVDLPPPLRAQYKRYSGIYHSFLKKRNLRGLTGFRRMVMMTGTNAEARAALEAYRQARKLAFDSTAKIETVADILKRHRGDRILLFSESVQFVERVSREFLIPSITSRTPSDERKLILSLFRQGEVPIVAASRVLDEGIDIPEASVGIVVSGSGQPRQFVQRLGRLLRPSAPGKRAILYEVLATGTSEYQTSSRRRAGTGRREKRNKSGSG